MLYYPGVQRGVTISVQAKFKWVKVQVGGQLEGTGQAEADAVLQSCGGVWQ